MHAKNSPHIRLEPAPTNYSDAMPDIHKALNWQTLNAAEAVATESNRPIFAVVVAPWSTGAHLLSRELEEEATRQLLTDNFVPVLIDPLAEPSMTAMLAALARYQGGYGGLPILAALSPQLHPAFAITFIGPENRQPEVPTTASLLQSLSDQWSEDPQSFADEWKRVKGELETVPAKLEKDFEAGGFKEFPRHLHPYRLLEESDRLGGDDSWLLHTLSTIWDKGIRDQLEASFHPQTRDETWVIPYFEKCMPQNAAMALVYARAAKQTGDRELRSKAQDLMRIVLGAALQKTDILSAESQYYTWQSTEVYDAVSRANLQSISLIYNIQPNARRMVLSKARAIEDMTSISYEEVSEHEGRFLAGNAELLMHRRTRPAPRPVSVDQSAWRAETWRWLLLASEAMESADSSLLTSGFLTWLEEARPEASSDAHNNADVRFQNNVSVLASLLIAKRQVDDPSIDALIPDMIERVREGIQYWQQAERNHSIWLRQHGYLPSVESTLETISTLLPENEKLPSFIVD